MGVVFIVLYFTPTAEWEPGQICAVSSADPELPSVRCYLLRHPMVYCRDVRTQASEALILPGFLTYQVENTFQMASVKAVFCLVWQKTQLDSSSVGPGSDTPGLVYWNHFSTTSPLLPSQHLNLFSGPRTGWRGFGIRQAGSPSI